MSPLSTRHTALVIRKQSNITVTDRTVCTLAMRKQSNITVTHRTVCTLTVKIFNIIYLFDYYMKLHKLLGLCSAE